VRVRAYRAQSAQAHLQISSFWDLQSAIPVPMRAQSLFASADTREYDRQRQIDASQWSRT